MKPSNIRPISDLKNHARQLVEEVAKGGGALVITQNGKPQAVMMGVVEHERLNDALLMMKLLAHGQEVQRQTGSRYSTAEVRRLAKAALARAAVR
jgi:prevent-host-death family protein